MSLAVLYSRALAGMDAPLVTVEAHLANGLPAFTIVGLPEAEVKEAKDRVRAALQNAHFEFPARRITVNLAPADLPKESGRFDLPIALGILAASRPDSARSGSSDCEFAGELALTGELRPVRGALAMTLDARREGRALRAAAAPTRRGGAGRRTRAFMPRARCSRSARISPAASRSSAPQRRRRTLAVAPIPISPTSKARRRPSARWKSPPPAGTAC